MKKLNDAIVEVLKRNQDWICTESDGDESERQDHNDMSRTATSIFGIDDFSVSGEDGSIISREELKESLMITAEELSLDEEYDVIEEHM